MNKTMTHDAGLLTAALAGYELRLKEVTERIDEVRRRLNGAAPRQPRRISKEGLERIREGQRRRWAAVKRVKKSGRVR